MAGQLGTFPTATDRTWRELVCRHYATVSNANRRLVEVARGATRYASLVAVMCMGRRANRCVQPRGKFATTACILAASHTRHRIAAHASCPRPIRAPATPCPVAAPADHEESPC